MEALINSLHQIVNDCTHCDLKHLPYSLQSYHYQSGAKLVMIIGEAPGEEETLTLQPFTGQSGMLLREWLPLLGINNYVITNMVKHRPPNNATPTKKQIQACAPFLNMEIAVLQPQIYLLLGHTASTLLNLPSTITMKQMVQQTLMHPYQLNGVPALVMYHPSYFLRMGKRTNDILPLLKLMRKVILLQ
jgi:DNA polymerase